MKTKFPTVYYLFHQNVVQYTLAVSILIIICLNIGWLIKCMRRFLIVVKKYQTCKKTPIPNSVCSIGAAVLLKRGYHGAAGGTFVECGNKEV